MSYDLDNQSTIELKSDTPILVAAAWPYVNGDIHVGHLHGYFLPADIFARFNRLKGRPVLMVSGSDCHGTPITVAADKEGVSPEEIVEKYHPKVLELISSLGVQYDLYTKTITDNHRDVTQDVFIRLANNGYISTKITPQYYSEVDNKFLPDREVEGKCPICSFEPARADQCDNCGNVLSEGELLNPHSRASGAAVTFKDTENYFFDLDKLQLDLEKYVEDKTFWKEWVLAETKGWLKKGLIGRSISRDMNWGIKIPQDQIPENLKIEGIENKRFYVWFDAVIGYLSASIEWSDMHKSDQKNAPIWLDWKHFWYNKDARHYYFMGKDNLFFHTIMWPAMLLGSDREKATPYFPSINQFLNLEGKKFSKSRGVVLYPKYVIDNYGIDILRYYMTSIMPENKDSDWSWKGFVAANNNELVANLGNFIHRVLSFYKMHPELDLKDHLDLTVEKVVEDEIIDAFYSTGRFIEECRFVESLQRIMSLSSFGNKYFNDNEPWVTVKNNSISAAETIYNCLTLISSLKILLHPFIPHAMDRLNKMLGFDDEITTSVGKDQWCFKPWYHQQILEEFITPLFNKFEEKDVLEKEKMS